MDVNRPISVNNQSNVNSPAEWNLKQTMKMPIYFLTIIIIGWFQWYALSEPGIMMVAPTLAAILVASVYEGRQGVSLIFKRLVRWRAHFGWYLAILLIPAVIAFIAIGIHGILGGELPGFPLFRENQFQILMVFFVFIFPLTSSAFMQEIGFRGYALPQLQEKFGPMRGTLLLGVFFGAWLLPEFYKQGSAQFVMGIDFYIWFIVTEIAWSLIMTWVFNRTNGSSLIAGWLFHAFFNAWTLLLLTNTIPGSDLPIFDMVLFRINTIVLALLSIGLVIKTRGKLGYEQRN